MGVAPVLHYVQYGCYSQELTKEQSQVLHSGGNHWVTASSIDCKPEHVNIFDSLLSGVTCRSVKRLIAAIVNTDISKLVLDLREVQTQRGSSDCGLFIVAFATSLCKVKTPPTSLVSRGQMIFAGRKPSGHNCST